MSSSWGKSWGKSWGNSWGPVGVIPTPTPAPTPNGSGGAIDGNKYRIKKPRELQVVEVLVCISGAHRGMQWGVAAFEPTLTRGPTRQQQTIVAAFIAFIGSR